MPTCAFHPAREEHRRGDGLNFALATAATALAARAAAETLLGEPNALAGCSAVDLARRPSPSSPACRSARDRSPSGRSSPAAATR